MASGKLLSRVFYDDLEGWDEGREGRLEREGIYIYIYIIMVASCCCMAETNTTL